MIDVRKCSTPEFGGPSMHIRRLKANEDLQFIVLSRALVGIWTHWMKGASMPCVNPRSSCKGCIGSEPTRQKFLLHVYSYYTKQEEVLELPPGAAQDFLEFYPMGATIRGQRLKIKRGGGKKARLTVDILPPYDEQTIGPLPAEKDPVIPLIELWSLDKKSTSFTKDSRFPKDQTG